MNRKYLSLILAIILLSACSFFSVPINNLVEITEEGEYSSGTAQADLQLPSEVQTLEAYPAVTMTPSLAITLSSMNSVAPTPNAPTDCVIRIGAPDGDVIRPLLGVNTGPLPAGKNSDNPDLTQAYQAIGINMVRTHDYYGPLDMGEIYPDQNADPNDPTSYHFKESDRVFRAILTGGFEPYFRLGDSWNVRGLEERAPVDFDNWIRAAVFVIRRYYEMSIQAGNPMRYVEIWNEPDNKQFWDGTDIEFYDLFARTANAIKEEFPDLEVGGPGFTPGGALTPYGKKRTENFLSYLQSHQVPLDFFSWHIYANDPDAFTTAAMFYREQLDAHGFNDVESHITEWNTSVKQSREPGAADLRYTAQGASIMSAAWIGLQQQHVDVSTFYRGPDPDINAPQFYGMFYADGNPKPIALVFSFWSKIVGHSSRLEVSAESQNDLWLLAGRNESGEIALLIANPRESSSICQIVLNDNFSEEMVTLNRVDATSDEIQTFLSGMVVEIPSYSTQLLLINP